MSHNGLKMTKHKPVSKSCTGSAAQNRYKPSTLSSAERVSKGVALCHPQPSIRAAGLLRVLCVVLRIVALRCHIGRTHAQKLFALCAALLLTLAACTQQAAQERPALPATL